MLIVEIYRKEKRSMEEELRGLVNWNRKKKNLLEF